ncbi:hypothetical protein [Polaromonas sp. CG9_12]|nr:hypothetical protein [Polaromonas sp. CG9_12]
METDRPWFQATLGIHAVQTSATDAGRLLAANHQGAHARAGQAAPVLHDQDLAAEPIPCPCG